LESMRRSCRDSKAGRFEDPTEVASNGKMIVSVICK
jgi:hypothetical protein